MKDQILDFVSSNPIVLIPVLLLLPIVYRRRYLRYKRRTSHVNDAKSNTMVIVGLVAAAIIIAAYLYNS